MDMGCHVYRLPSYTKPLAYITAIKKLCYKNKYIIVHSHMNTMSVFSLFAAWLGKTPVRIAHSHSTSAKGKGETGRNILKHMLRPFSKIFATHYFACSDHAARWLFGDDTVDKGKVVIINNAIPVEKFVFNAEKREEMRKKLGLKGKFVIANVGRFSPPKNHLFLIDVFNAVNKICSNAHLLIIGGIGSAGKGIEEHIKEKLRDYGIYDKVSFIGTIEDIGSIYQAMDVFILPSLYEGLGISSIEAQCSGVPCILSDRVPREAQINENVVFLPLEEPPNKWAKVVIASSGERGDYSVAIGRAGYSITEVARKLECLYIKYVVTEEKM